MKRPLVLVALSYAAGTYAAAACLCRGIVLPSAVLAAGLVFALLARSRPRSRPPAVAVCVFAVAALLWTGRHAGPPGDPLSRSLAAQPSADWSIEGRVRQADLLLEEQPYARFILDVDTVHAGSTAVPLKGGVAIRWHEPDGPVYVGDRVLVDGDLGLSIGHVNPRIQDFEDHMRRHAVHTAARAKGPGAVQRLARGRWWSPFHMASRLRTAQARRVAKVVPESVLPFVLAVWFGDRGRITRETYQTFVESGTAHILAVSGIHAAIVFVSVSFILRAFVRDRRRRALLAMGVVLVFALLAGARITTVRATVMIGIYVAADLFDRERDARTALSISALVFMLWNPDMVFEVGFLLSFSSVASILLFSDRIAEWLAPVPWWIREGAAATLAVQILPLPLALRFFHVLPLAAPLANLLVVPLLTVALWLCFLVSASVWVSSDLALLFGHALWPVVALVRMIVETIAKPSLAHPTLVTPTIAATAAYWGCVGMISAFVLSRVRKAAYAVGAGLLAVMALVCWKPLIPGPEVVFIDVGHGDAIFARSPGGTTVLVDAGEASPVVDMGARIVAPFLWGSGVSHLDYVVVTHPDQDHIGGVFYILDHFSVGKVVLSGIASDRRLEVRLLKTCRSRGIPVERVFLGDTLQAKGAEIAVLHPDHASAPDCGVNDSSVVLRMTCRDETILLSGDIERAAESKVRATGCAAQVLKVPHHGSRTSSTDEFIDAVSPQFAVVSTGGERGREAVHPGVLRRYLERNIEVLRTDQLGGIRLSWKKGKVNLIGAREQRGYVHVPRPSPSQ